VRRGPDGTGCGSAWAPCASGHKLD
jgi:hypothetical protein